jgi:hypothetical protein
MTDADPQDLLRLADEVAAATGPDRELDEAILIAIGGKKKSADWWLGFAYIGRVIPAYTASLDAAMMLLRPEWGYEQRRPSDLGTHGCSVEIWWVPAFPQKVHAIAATPALALCAAALKARAHSTKESDNG